MFGIATITKIEPKSLSFSVEAAGHNDQVTLDFESTGEDGEKLLDNPLFVLDLYVGKEFEVDVLTSWKRETNKTGLIIKNFRNVIGPVKTAPNRGWINPAWFILIVVAIVVIPIVGMILYSCIYFNH